jgi:hypothetical protein
MREPRECGSGFKKRGFPQLALRASRHGLFLTGTGEATPSNLAAKQAVVWCSFDCSATCVPNRLAIHGPGRTDAGERSSTWATPESGEGCRGCRALLPAAEDFIRSLLAAGLFGSSIRHAAGTKRGLKGSARVKTVQWSAGGRPRQSVGAAGRTDAAVPRAAGWGGASWLATAVQFALAECPRASPTCES